MPEDKPEDKSEAEGDPEVTALATAIAGEMPPPIITEGESASSKEKPTSEEKVEPKEGEEKPEGEKPEEGEQEDSLKDLAGDAKTAVKVLLEHPTLGPLLQSWSDRAGAAQVSTALERERPTIQAETKRLEAERTEDERFSGMTREQIVEEISGDEEAAASYARFQQRKEAGPAPNAEAVTQASQLYAYASRVAAVSSLLEGSGLKADVKESLKGGNFTHLGEAGIREWEKAVFSALVTDEADGLVTKGLEEKWEAYKTEHLAEIDGERPALISGRKDGPVADLIKTPSEVLLESGLTKIEKERTSK